METERCCEFKANTVGTGRERVRYRDRWTGGDGREGDRVRQHVLGRERDRETERERKSLSLPLTLSFSHMGACVCPLSEG